MRPPRTHLTLTEWIVLALVGEGPTHGWACVRALRPDGPVGVVWSARGPLVYRAIRLLERAGLIAATGPAMGRGPSRTVLEITPAGSEGVNEWLIEPVAHIRDLRVELLVKLILHDRRGLDPSLLMLREHERLEPMAVALADRAATAKGADRLVAIWRSTAATAALDFVAKVQTEQETQADPSAIEPGSAS